VVREGVNLAAVGKVSSFARDLSPIQVGARGDYGGRSFSVAGVLRKARDRVRWNEWYVVFDDGRGGWLGEGNGEYQIFAEDPVPVRGASRPRVGAVLPIEGVKWKVTEAAKALIVAAQGELPYPVTQSRAFSYADLRSTDGKRFATLDFDSADDPPLLYVGRVVTLQSLKLQGLRHFTGWSDPALTGFQGPDVEAVRSLKCAGCGADIKLRAPGETVRVACEYCGSLNGTQEGPGGGASSLKLIERSEKARFKPPVPLGGRGAIEGCGSDVSWECIGAMVRYVRIEGVDYSWVEHMLHNPYRGYAWLIVDGQGHWNFVTRIPDLPKGEAGSWRPVKYRGDKFKHFQSGAAHVRSVVGEFTWEVRAGDVAHTADYVAPPQMLSSEVVGGGDGAEGEITWTKGVWLAPDAVEDAFGLNLAPATGVAPNQPNPYDASGGQAMTRALMLLAAVCLLWVFQAFTNDRVDLVDATWKTSDGAADVFVTEPFQVFEGEVAAAPPAGDPPEDGAPEDGAPEDDPPEDDPPEDDPLKGGVAPPLPEKPKALDTLQLQLSTPIDRRDGQVHVALMNLNSGRVYLMDFGQGKKNEGKAWLRDPEIGNYVARIELAKNPSRKEVAFHRDVTLKVRAGVAWRTPLFLAGLLALLAPLFHALARGAFETKRWSQSDHAG